MTKVVAVYNDDYKIVVQNGGTIYRSGIQIDRGTLPVARFIFDERIGWTLGGSSGLGTFIIETGDISDEETGDYIPLALAGIKGVGPNGKLYIDTDNSVISVTNTNDYEEEIFNYVAGVITDEGSGVVIDDDHVPNTKSVVDYVDYYFGAVFQDKIEENDTRVETKDFETTGSESEVEITVDGIVTAQFFDNRIETQGLHLQDNILRTKNSNEDLVLKAPGTGAVQIDDILELVPGPDAYDDDPTTQVSAPLAGTRLYTTTQGTGQTGLYYVNNSNTRDEFISKNRSLLFSMLF